MMLMFTPLDIGAILVAKIIQEPSDTWFLQNENDSFVIRGYVIYRHGKHVLLHNHLASNVTE